MTEPEEIRQENQQQNRHYDIICLTLTTIGGATLAAVMLLSDAPEILQGNLKAPSSSSQWISIVLATLATGAYAAMTATSRVAIFHHPKPESSPTEHKRQLTSWVFNILIGIAATLVLVTAVSLITVLADAVWEGNAATQQQGSPENTP